MPGRILPLILIAVAAIGLDVSGGLKWLDDDLVELRMRAVPHAPTGAVAIVDIDARSLAAVGRWPWPRSVHATIVDRLTELGAGTIAFDIDFSAASDEDEDAQFEAALKRAGGSVVLASFRQNASAQGGSVLTAPLARFADNAWPAIINVVADADGRVRSLPYGALVDGVPVPSMAALVGGGNGALGRDFIVDYSIAPEAIDRISAIDVINGTVDPARIAGKSLVVGASAVELRDFFFVPVHGIVSGSLLQAMGAESILTGRTLARTGNAVAPVVAVLLVAGVWLAGLRWTTTLLAAAIAALVAELVAGVVQAVTPLVLTTAPLQAALALLAAATVVREINARAARITFMARFDPLTGLANRNQFLDRLGRVEGYDYAVVAIRLDRFDGISETFGHVVADALLCAVADRIGMMIGPSDLLARLDGDALVALIVGSNASARGEHLARALIARVGEPYLLSPHRLVAALSFGIAQPGPRRDPDGHLKAAETALHRAEATGGNAYAVFDRAMLAGQPERLALEVDLWAAFENEEFEVYYQPQVDLRDGRMTGVEALLRWNHPERGVVSPSDLVPVAEAVGLIEPIGKWILERACREVARWPGEIRLAVNVSPTQFTRGDLVSTVRHALSVSGLPAERLDIEITESVFIEDRGGAQKIIADLHAMGVGCALDDFGVGYSSLAYLRKFAIDKVKLDRSFIEGVPSDHEAVAIVRAVGAMAQSLGVRLLAEGIEHPEQVAFLRVLGFSEGQGYLFGAPLRESALVQLLEAEMPAAEPLSREVRLEAQA